MAVKRKALLPQPIEQEAMDVLKANGVEVVTAAEPKPEIVGPLMKDAQALILRTGIKITRELLAYPNELMTISRTGAGVDNVDLPAATEKGIIVTSSIGANTTSVAEHALALILALFKQLFLMDAEVRKGNFAIRYQNCPTDLRDKTIGIVGFGRIGSLIARGCQSLFAMKVLAYDLFLSEEQKTLYRDWVRFTDLPELCRNSDVISLHTPLSPETHGMFNWRLFSQMKRTAFIINTSRGGVIDEGDLIRALKEGVIAGAGLDVFEHEPIPPGNALLDLKNVILTPHTAALTEECVKRMAVTGAQRVVDLFSGLVPDNVANPEVLALDRWKSLKKGEGLS
jgi:D-3-phosphoglycerate dehydrogenase / 2-oxoglutarate reductase